MLRGWTMHVGWRCLSRRSGPMSRAWMGRRARMVWNGSTSITPSETKLYRRRSDGDRTLRTRNRSRTRLRDARRIRRGHERPSRRYTKVSRHIVPYNGHPPIPGSVEMDKPASGARGRMRLRIKRRARKQKRKLFKVGNAKKKGDGRVYAWDTRERRSEALCSRASRPHEENTFQAWREVLHRNHLRD